MMATMCRLDLAGFSGDLVSPQLPAGDANGNRRQTRSEIDITIPHIKKSSIMDILWLYFGYP